MYFKMLKLKVFENETKLKLNLFYFIAEMRFKQNLVDVGSQAWKTVN